MTNLAFEAVTEGRPPQPIEQRRLQEQQRLDALKTPAQRNKWGQFATPPDLARSIARYVLTLMPNKPVRFLDPAVGTGSFFSALCHESGNHPIASAHGFELDPLFAKAASALWTPLCLQVAEQDFTRQSPPHPRFNLLLANPPYVRHHHLSTAEKLRLKSRLTQSLHVEISGLAGLYCYFLLLSHEWMEEDGVAAWLIPSEFMDVNYGTALRRYFTQSVTLVHIHRFSPTDTQFTDALVSSAVVVFRKSPPPAEHHVRISLGGTIDNPQSEALVPLVTLAGSNKWTRFPKSAVVNSKDGPTLGDLFAIKRGLATGANSFFILTGTEVEQWEIPRQFLKAILPGPRYLTDDIVNASPGGAPEVSPQLYLLDCAKPEDEVRRSWPRFYEYLQTGRDQNVHSSYITSRREPWYSQEKRPPAPFLCTYMGRSGNGKSPLRFLWNRSQATARNVYLMLYPRGQFRDALIRNPQLEASVFQALQRITPAQMLSEARVYGGGLHKVEPKELARIPAQSIIESLGFPLRIEHQVDLFI